MDNKKHKSMKRFLITVSLAAGLLLLLDVAFVVGRIIVNQDEVDAAFDVPPGTEVIFIGNSHTGCTFVEAPEFRNWVLWRSSTGFSLHYIRFREFERRGVLDRGVKVVVMDCDRPAMSNCRFDGMKFDITGTYPCSWRYLTQMPMSMLSLVSEILLYSNRNFWLRESPPADSIDWVTRMNGWTKEERDYYLKAEADAGQTPSNDWDSETIFPKNWRKWFDEKLLDMKARCEEHGVRLVLFASPVSSQSSDRTNPRVYQNVSDIAAHVREMGIEYYDFRTACLDNQFRDAGHLLRRSAYEFTKKFYEDVLKLPVGELRSIE